jgi:hypothetical protein
MAVLQGLKDDTVYAYSFVINPFLRQLANQVSTIADMDTSVRLKLEQMQLIS